MLDNTPKQSSKCKAKTWVEINGESRGTYNEDNQIRFKNSILRSSLCDYSDAYILFQETITVRNTAVQGQANNVLSKKVIFKNCAPFTEAE